MKRNSALMVGILAILVAFCFAGAGCDMGENPAPDEIVKVTEAEITVTGLSEKKGKYLSAFVLTLGELSSSKSSYTSLLESVSAVSVASSSVTVNVTGDDSDSIDPNGKYDILIMLFNNPDDKWSADYKEKSGVQFTSGKAVVSY